MRANDETRSLEDPRLAGGEWLFRRSGEVFGPVDSRRVAELLYRGEIEAGTPVSKDDGGHWTPVGEVPLFVVHAKKAEARLRVEREITSAKTLERRRRRLRAVALVAASVLVVAGAGVAALLATRPPPGSELLEDFGEGIRITSAAKVGVSRRAAAAEDEVEVILEPLPAAAPGRPATHRDRPAAAAAGPASAPVPGPQAAAGDLVAEARFDAAAIQAAVARQQRSLVPCFRAEAVRSPDYRGQVPLEFTIGNDGRVAALYIDDPQFRQGALRDCLVQALASWRFDTFPGQRPTVQLAFGVGR